MKLITQSIVLLSILFSVSSSFAQNSTKQLEREIAKIKKEIQTEKDRFAREKERATLFEQQSSKRLRDSDQQYRLIKSQSDSLRKEVNSLKASNKKLSGSAYYYQNKRKKYAASLAVLLDSLAAGVLSGFPFESESHSEALKSTASGLRSGAIPPEEGLSRAWAVLMARIKKGYESERYSGTLSTEEGELSGTYLRFGQAMMLFKDQDGNQLKYLSNQGEYKWESVPQDIELRRQFKEIFDVMEGKVPPQLVKVPVRLPQVKGGEQ